MTPVDYFKLQAKNLFKDFKTQYVYEVDKDGTKHYTYRPKFFNVDGIFLDFDIYDEEPFSLMKAQHLIARMLGFKKWSSLINASEVELEYAQLRFLNQGKITLGDWEEHLGGIEAEHGEFAPEDRLEFFKHSLSVAEAEGSYGGFCINYLLDEGMKRAYATRETRQQAPQTIPNVQITSLPLSEGDRAEFIATANSVFEKVFDSIKPNNPEDTRKLWDAADYVDNHLLAKDMLPISRAYALSLIEALLVHHVIGLATQADKAATST